ncbi:MAG: ATPase domain-containing protein [Candidatus Micrarchaeia archaeon]|jgi:KaiC/GvpD/RAD55 family RecA-like ATPase
MTSKKTTAKSIARADIPRVQTGFPVLDQMLQGGLPAGSITLLSGACGTGKSTFAMQFLYNGAKYCNEPGVYVTLEEDPKKLIENMDLFGWDVQGLIDSKRMIVIKPEIYKFDSIKRIIEDAIEKIGAKRLVVDSYSVMLTYFSDPYEVRNGLVQLDREIKKMDCTALVISDIKDNSEIFSTTGVEEFIVDGVIVLYLTKSERHPLESVRALAVRKMRATHHSLRPYLFEIGKDGVEVGGVHTTDASMRAGKPKAERKRGRALAKKEKKNRGTSIDLSKLRSDSKRGHSWKWRHL